ncbi:hypothetical protein ACHAQH_001994 [Verticillium albo-atrum]
MGDPVTEEAPFPLTDTDKWVLSLTDEEFKLHDWDDLKSIIEANRLEVFKRKPSDLRRYMKWTSETKAEYGSMTNYLLAHRLPKAWGAPPFTPTSTVPFAEPADYRVLINDWPYGLTPDVTHVVVWSRTPIETDPQTGDMTAESRRLIQEFVDRYFVDDLGADGKERVLWFKNWVALQSVRALEHFHVLVKNADPELLETWAEEKSWHRGE